MVGLENILKNHSVDESFQKENDKAMKQKAFQVKETFPLE